MREVATPSATGDEEMLSVSHLTGVTPRSEKTVYMFEAESTVGYKLVAKGDLVINTMWAWMGAAGTAPVDGIVSPAYGVYRIDNSIADPRWVDYVIRTPRYVTEMTRHSRGVTSSRLRLYPDEFLRLSMSVPTLAEQRAIADYLDAETARIDALVAKKQQLVHLLEERFRSGLTALVTDRAPRTRTSSEWFGSLPEGWRCARLGSLTTRILDGPHVSPRYVDESGIPFLSVRNIGLHDWNLSTAKFIALDDFESFNRRIQPTTGDVLLTKGGNTGIARMVDLDFPFQVWVHVAILRPGPRVLPEYLTACLNSHAGYAQSQVWTRGATNQDLVLSRIAQIEIPVPPTEVQRRIVGELARFYRADQDLRSALRRQIDLLTEHRQALISAIATPGAG